MSKPLRRLHLRLTPDNPIFFVPEGQRTKKADEWLKLGAEIERLERVIDRLERTVKEGSCVNPIQQELRPAANARRSVIDAFENW